MYFSDYHDYYKYYCDILIVLILDNLLYHDTAR